MNKIYRIISWTLGIAVVFCVLLFGWRVLLNQSQEQRVNPYEYDIDRYRKVDPALIHYDEAANIKLHGTSFHALAVDANNNIIAAMDNSIFKYSPDGKLLKSAALPGPCYAIAAGPDDSLYLGIEDHISVFDSELSEQTTWTGLGENARITSLAVTKARLYAADAGQRLVWKMSLDGKMTGQAGLESEFIVPSPYFDVATIPFCLWAPEDSPLLAVVNPGKTRIETYNPDDSASGQWGTAGMEIEAFSGCCNPSHLAVTPDGMYVTTEKGLPRVKTYNASGKLVSVVAGPEQFREMPPGCFSEAIIKDLAVDSNGRILVLDRLAAAIRIFTKKDM